MNLVLYFDNHNRKVNCLQASFDEYIHHMPLVILHIRAVMCTYIIYISWCVPGAVPFACVMQALKKAFEPRSDVNNE